MGVDLATYRSRIGCFKCNSGAGFATLCITVTFSKAATWTSIFATLTCLLGIVVSHKYSQATQSEESIQFGVVDVLIISCGLIWNHQYLSLNQIIKTLKCIGVVAFIGILLLLAGIEPNPGPIPRQDGGDDNPNKNVGETEPLNYEYIDDMVTVNQRKTGGRVTLVRNKLQFEQVDVIACLVDSSLNLGASGKTAEALLAFGGDILQRECEERFPSGIKFGDVIAINGGELKCKKVYLSSLLDIEIEEDENYKAIALQTTICKMLNKAIKENVKSIALPALGTSKLRLAPNKAASILYGCVKNLSEGSLSEIRFILNDKATYKAFEKEHLLAKDSDLMSTDYREILGMFDLTKYFPAKLTFDDIMALQLNDSDEITISNLPKKLIQGIMTLNFEARDCLQEKIISKERKKEKEKDPFVDDEDDSDCTKINNLDIFIAVFNCCDSFLKQKIVNKMIMCRLAVPIIYPLMSSNRLCFSIWPLRSSTLALKGKTTMEVSPTNHPMGIVSFIRYGRPSLSKSHLINGILSNYSHPIFYHNDCHMGNKQRTISNGLVEASWYIPTRNSRNFSDDVLMFLNLRGDARMHEQQTHLLQRISSLLVVIVDFQMIKEYITEIKAMNLCPSSYILLLTCNSSTVENISEQISVIDICKSQIPGVNIMRLFDKGRQKNAANLICVISKLLKTETKRLEDCISVAHKLGIVSDEDNSKCRASKILADKVLKHLKFENPSFQKARVLPLQCESWKKFTEFYKESKKTGKDFLDDNEKTKEKLKEVRKEQTEMCKSLSPLLVKFIQVIFEHNTDREVILYFLYWMKFYLDDRSLDILPPLAVNISDRLDNSESDSEQRGKNILEMEQAVHEMENASLGLKQIFREIGQLYEAFIHRNLREDLKMPFSVKNMPDIVSKILLHGFAFEIMDGDTTNIPTTWTKSVFGSLQRQIGNKKVLVISVFGVQCSGKSTFLNTMFGLKFPVSSRRCTRGIYMQLLPVKKTNALFSFDFLLVLDTEGIRVPELGLNIHNRYHELATLSLGMSDLAIINIKGENTAEVHDLLQVVVHAFLRLKLTNKKLKLNQSCMFVHQNVPDVNAEEKSRQARIQLVQALDEMTLSAAKQENIADITSFQQVIDFDFTENVWYVADLWQGTSPMAHVNAEYSNKVMEIKAAILKIVSTKTPSLRFISEVSSCMLDIVNSSRNRLELKVYNTMEMKFQELCWEFEKYTSMLYSAVKDKLDGNETTEDTNRRISKDFEEEANAKMSAIKKDLEKYFYENENRKIVIQWKESKLLYYHFFTIKMIKKHIHKLERKHQELQVEVKTQFLQAHYLEEITHKAEELAKTFKQKSSKAGKAHIESCFNEMWREWSYGIPQFLSSEEDLEEEVKRILLDKFSGLRNYLQEENRGLHLSKWPGKENLTENIDFVCKIGFHISIKQSFDKCIKTVSKKTCEERARQFTERLLQEIDIDIQRLKCTDTKFEGIYLSSILFKVDKKFKTHNSDDSKELFTFLPPYQAKVLVYICQYVVYVFQKINERYNKRHSPRSYMETFKQTTRTLFVNLVSEKSPEGIAANMVCDLVHSKIKELLNENLNLEFAKYLSEHFKNSKQRLLNEMLKDLVDKNNFKYYRLYIADPKVYAIQWLMSQNKLSFSKSMMQEKMKTMIRTFISSIIEALDMAIYKARFSQQKQNGNITPLMRRFEIALRKRNLPLPSRFFRQVCKYEIELENEFYDIAKKYLSETQEKLYEEYKNINIQISHLHISDFEKIIERLWGCDDNCPFCHEPCQRLKHHTTRHSCVQHKPLLTNGMIDGKNNEGMLGSCSFYVQTSKKFNCIASGLECRKSVNCKKKIDTVHYYKKYRKVLPRWDIAPCTEYSSSQYWCWFVVQFKHELEEYHGIKIKNIPHSWNNLSKDDAKRSLKEF